MLGQTSPVLQALLILSAIVRGKGQTNLLQNADFESADFTGNWKCRGGCKISQNSDAYTGNYSVKITDR